MITDLREKIDTLYKYSINQKPQYTNEYKALLEPLRVGVENYFSGERKGFKTALNALEHDFYNDIIKRQTVYEKPVDFKMSVDFPPAYNDLRLLFYTFPLMDVDNQTFFNAWVEEVPTIPTSDTGGTGEKTVTKNTLIDLWVKDIGKAIPDELTNIKTLMEWLENCSSDAGMVLLWEETGRILSQPNTKEIAKIIFVDKHFNECLKKLNLTAYKPTYL